MNTIATVTATAVVAAGLALAGSAVAVPSTPSGAADVIVQLAATGNSVIVNKTGAQFFDACTVGHVRPGATSARFDPGLRGASRAVTRVISLTDYVDVSC